MLGPKFKPKSVPWESVLQKTLRVTVLYHLTLQIKKSEMRERNWFAQGHTTMTAAAAAAKSLQSCPTLCDPIDGRPPGSPVPGILQARTLEWVAISFSNAWKWKVKVKLLSRLRLFVTPWTAAYQASLSMGFSRQSTGVGCHCLLRFVTQG